MFKNRDDAGKRLAERINLSKNDSILVVAIPRGGLPLGSIIAKKLNAPLDVALIKKIRHPFNREYAIGAMSLDNIFLDDTHDISNSYLNSEIGLLKQKLKLRYQQYYKKRRPHSLKDKVVILVDDGIATGNTVMASVKLISQQHPKKIILAIPVASPLALVKLKSMKELNEIICLLEPTNFRSVGQFYIDFSQVTDHEAISIIDKHGVLPQE